MSARTDLTIVTAMLTVQTLMGVLHVLVGKDSLEMELTAQVSNCFRSSLYEFKYQLCYTNMQIKKFWG